LIFDLSHYPPSPTSTPPTSTSTSLSLPAPSLHLLPCATPTSQSTVQSTRSETTFRLPDSFPRDTSYRRLLLAQADQACKLLPSLRPWRAFELEASPIRHSLPSALCARALRHGSDSVVGNVEFDELWIEWHVAQLEVIARQDSGGEKGRVFLGYLAGPPRRNCARGKGCFSSWRKSSCRIPGTGETRRSGKPFAPSSDSSTSMLDF
jgi:hypothetical protein